MGFKTISRREAIAVVTKILRRHGWDNREDVEGIGLEIIETLEKCQQTGVGYTDEEILDSLH